MQTMAAELARHAAQIPERVERGERVTVERHGRAVAELRPAVDVTVAELPARLKRNPLTAEQRAELLAATKKAGEVFDACGA